MTDGSSVILLLRMVFSLVIVLAAVLVLARFLQRRQGVGIRTTRKANIPVRVLSRMSLSRTASIQVVEIGRETLVLSVTDAGVSLLRELPVDAVFSETPEVTDQTSMPGQLRATRTRNGGTPPLIGRSKAAQTAQQAFEVMLSRMAIKQAEQAEQAEECDPAPTDVLSRRGRHRG